MKIVYVILAPIVILCGMCRDIRLSGKQRSYPSPNSTTDSILHFWLDKSTVFHDQINPKKLYVWLSEAERDSVLAQNSLLFSSSLTQFERNYYEELYKKENLVNPVAGLLRKADRLRMQDAWPTMLQTNGPSCDQLFEVELDERAWIVQFVATERCYFTVFDMKGKIVALPDVQREPERIAAVYFVNKLKNENTVDSYYGVRGRPDKVRSYYKRSFFLVNESMITHWHHGTPGLQDEILKQINYGKLFDAWLNSDEGRFYDQEWLLPQVIDEWETYLDPTIMNKYFATFREADGKIIPGFPDVILRTEISDLQKCWARQKTPIEKFPSKN